MKIEYDLEKIYSFDHWMGTLILQHLTKNKKQNSSTLGGTGEGESTNKTPYAAFPSCWKHFEFKLTAEPELTRRSPDPILRLHNWYGNSELLNAEQVHSHAGWITTFLAKYMNV